MPALRATLPVATVRRARRDDSLSKDAHAQHDAHTVDITLTSHDGDLVGTAWEISDPQWIAVISHGYGEHVGRYGWVEGRLNAPRAGVFAVPSGKSPPSRI